MKYIIVVLLALLVVGCGEPLRAEDDYIHSPSDNTIIWVMGDGNKEPFLEISYEYRDEKVFIASIPIKAINKGEISKEELESIYLFTVITGLERLIFRIYQGMVGVIL